MPLTEKISRNLLRNQVHERILDRILDGSQEPGTQIIESSLAEELGVSRRPLREALFGLERDGFLKSEAGRGFRVQPLSVREVRETYPILGALDNLALRLTAVGALKQIPALEQKNTEMNKSPIQPKRLLELDAQWHDLLLNLCPNEKLQKMVRGLRQQVRRYEYAYMRSKKRVALSVREHAKVIACLRRKDFDRAGTFLEENWKTSVDTMGNWLGKVSEDKA